MAKQDLVDLLLYHIRLHEIKEPVLEHRFHPFRRWRFDISWPYQKLAVEVEGGIWVEGRHTRGSGFLKDCEKYNAAVEEGWQVLRYPVNLIKDGSAVLQIKRIQEGIYYE